MKWIFFSLTVAIFSLFAFFFYLYESKRPQKAVKRMQPWFEQNRQQRRRSIIFLIGDKYDQSELSVNLRQKLAQANLSLNASEYAGICVLLFAFLWVFTHLFLQLMFPLDVTISQILVWLGSRIYLRSRRNRRTEQFNKQLPEVCRMMANTIKAGLTLHQGIEIVGREAKNPAGTEFQLMNQQLRLGDSFEEVMDRFSGRIASDELQIFVNTILIQRRVGGNLAEVMSLMAETLEQRERVNKEIKTVTAEARFVALILPALPVAMAVMMNFVIPGFLNPLFTPWGLLILAIFAVLQLVAHILIRQITRIRV